MVRSDVSFASFLERQGDRVLRLGVEHLLIVVIALAIGTAVALVLGVVVARRPRARAVVLGSAG